ncbi:hypothetical protein COU57_07020 [Candidatus Pacearchaeota archaeon CG10_big_fil_rev_8_21_14_0_10_32_14]|nr:MAG: hypothetical protein COU57_07020 [Candidatus Pacearchaeota archaeon CG10_big_fil_rev_8_21_14_0_10_32_14]
MELKIGHYIGIVLGLVIFGVSFLFIGTPWFFFLIGVGLIAGSTPMVITVIIENRIAEEKEQMFLEFARSLVESVKTGTPVSKSIINLKSKPFGVLSPHVVKLANQISLGIPFSIALQTFAKDVNNHSISRSLTLIGQAEKAGGNIGTILEAVAEAVSLSDKLKKERKSAIQTLVAQGYIIFVVFLGIILVMQFKIIPLLDGLKDVQGASDLGIAVGGGSGGESVDFGTAFLFLLLIQGFFSGITIGLLSEGNIKAGIRHSFALMLMSFIIASGANILFDPSKKPEEVAAVASFMFLYVKYKIKGKKFF